MADTPTNSLTATRLEELLTTDEVAQYLKVKLPRVYELVAARRLKAFRVGRQLRFRHRDIEEFLERHTTLRWEPASR
ncbi:MAG: helix-turn-helix domain-containing protein [Armatimonadota bacterium]